MTKNVFSIAVAILFTGLGPGAVAKAQTDAPAATAVFSTELGRATLKPNPGLTINYTVTSTMPLDSQAVSQKLRFTVEEDGLREVTDSNGQKLERQGTFTHYLTINTGKYKTLEQLKGIVADMFRHFLAGAASAAPNTDLGKIGDARYGGEMHFMVDGPDALRCDYTPATPGVTTVQLKRRDVQALLDILEPRR